MENILNQFLAKYNIEQNNASNKTLSKLADNTKITEIVKEIFNLESKIITIFNMYKEKEDFKEHHLVINNANAKKTYNYYFNLDEFPNIVITEIKNLDVVGLYFVQEKNCIHGTPLVSNTIDLQIFFFNKDDENKVNDIKVVPFIVNADPKDLWLNKPSDPNSKYAKPDDNSIKDSFLDKKIVVASKRGRSHAHDGSFRDDDFVLRKLQDGWEIIAVADGAGSAKYAREGSRFATDFISKRFNNKELLNTLSNEIDQYFKGNTIDEENLITDAEEEKIKVKSSIINILYKEILTLHQELNKYANQELISVKDLNTTLIFALCKKIESGYVVLTFGVGDCPINVILDDLPTVKLLNTLDIGEFGGGTRFITMPEIFTKEIANRFSINKFKNFDKLFLMTDGIYDPKFITENKLENSETWISFIDDLAGNNEDGLKVDFEQDSEIENQLMQWMNFWSKGNHDDRTLAIIY